MTGFLGYDRDLVEALARAMHIAVDELNRLRCADVEAVRAMQHVARARAVVADRWLPFVDGLSGNRGMEGYRPVGEIDGLLADWRRRLVARPFWLVRTDPIGSGAECSGDSAEPVVTPDQAKALGAALSDCAHCGPIRPDEVAWLAGALEHIAGDPVLLAAFLPSLTDSGLTGIADLLARDRQQRIAAALLGDGHVSATEESGWAGIDRTFAALAAIAGSDRIMHPDADGTALLAEMTPLASALLVAELGLDAGALAAVTRDIVERERAALAYSTTALPGPRAADVLFETLLATPGAATIYVMATVDDPSLMLAVAADPDLGHRVATAGTAPADMTAAQAETALPALVAWFLDASRNTFTMRNDPALAVATADVIAPYLLPLLRPGSDGWGLSRRERRALEQLVIDDPDAFSHLLDQRERIVAALGAPLATDAATRLAFVRDVADLLAIIDTMQRAGRIQDAARANAEWELMWTLVGYGQGALPVSGAGAAVAGSAVPALRWALEQAGWGPITVAQARTDSLHRLDELTTVAAATLIATAFDQLVAEQRIPVGSKPPPLPDLSAADVGVAYSAAFTAWLGAAGFGAAVAYELSAVKETIASAHETMANANEGLLGS